MDPSKLHNDIEQVLITQEELDRRIQALAGELAEDYAERVPLLIGVLRGSVAFMGCLLTHLSIPLEVDFMSISSYGAATRSSGVVRIQKDLEEDVMDRHVLVVEDIVDTGLTINYLMRLLMERRPASIEVCTLLNKPARRLIEFHPRYVGFTIEDHFVVGFGLDYAQRYRNLPYIGVLKPNIYQQFELSQPGEVAGEAVSS